MLQDMTYDQLAVWVAVMVVLGWVAGDVFIQNAPIGITIGWSIAWWVACKK